MEVSGHVVIEVVDITKRFRTDSGEELTALDGISFTVRANEFVSIIGPSGCGKTTLLRILDGLVQADSGQVRIHGRPVQRPGPDRAVVFQDFALLPWRTVLGNVLFPLEVRGVPRAEREARAREAIQLVGLAGFEHYYPHALSGGMQQRVGLARALAVDPEILLMDEPFGALDAQTRQLLQDELLRLWERHKKTVILVTHDMHEAVYLSDRILVLAPRPGRVAKELVVDLPRPRDEQVRRTAGFAALVEDVWDLLRRLVRR